MTRPFPRSTTLILTLSLALASAELGGCGGGTPSKDNAGAGAAQQGATAAGWDAFGAPIAEAEPLKAADVMAAPDRYAGKSILVEGVVAEVCQAKGCWMTMQAADTEMRVRFKDYGFFVPKDCSGRTVRIEGTLAVEMVPVEEARHYLLDAGKQAEAEKITEPVKTITFMASGVRLKV